MKMQCQKIVDEILRRMPSRVFKMYHGFETEFSHILQETLEEMGYVSRQEFDAQLKLLHETQTKLTALEKEMAELEARIQTNL